MKPKTFDRSEHVYKNDAFAELVKDAVRFLIVRVLSIHGQPVVFSPALSLLILFASRNRH